MKIEGEGSSTLYSLYKIVQIDKNFSETTKYCWKEWKKKLVWNTAAQTDVIVKTGHRKVDFEWFTSFLHLFVW